MIKRYECYNSEPSDIGPHFEENELIGEWCKSEDVQKLEQQNKELVELVEECTDIMTIENSEHIFNCIDDVKEKLKEITND